MKKKIMTAVSIVLGPVIGSITFTAVIIPNGLTGGGLGGLAIVLSRATGLSIPLLLVAMFVPIAVWAFIRFGIRQILAASAGYILFTLMMTVLPLFIPVLETDPILAAILGGLLLGIGAGLVLRLDIANGPESLVGMHLKKKYGLPIGTFMMLFNSAIILSTAFFSDITVALYSAILVFFAGRITNYVILGFGRYYEMNILTSHYLELTEFIHDTILRGVTYIQCLGTYDLKRQMMVKVLVKNDELIKIKNHLMVLDPDCFIYINESTEVIGKGFSDPVQ